MLTKEQAKVDAWLAIADLMGRDYFREHFEGSCHSYPDDKYDDVEYEYFIGFDDIDDMDENDYIPDYILEDEKLKQIEQGIKI